MKRVIKQSDLNKIVCEISSYISQLPAAERAEYQKELEDVKSSFTSLVSSGVFHDACGKVINSKFVKGECQVTIVTEY